jgi:hypothetical protein
MTTLSLAAQAVINAAHQQPAFNPDGCPNLAGAVAAALRAVADQVVPDVDLHISVANDCMPREIGAAKWAARRESRREILAIAAELKAQP